MESNLSDVRDGLRSHSPKAGTPKVRGRRDGQQKHGSGAWEQTLGDEG